MKTIVEIIAGLIGFSGIVAVYVGILAQNWLVIGGGAVLFFIALFLTLKVTFADRLFG